MAKMDSVLVARDDSVDRRVVPRAETVEAKFVLVVGESRGTSVVKNWGAIWRIMAGKLSQAAADIYTFVKLPAARAAFMQPMRTLREE